MTHPEPALAGLYDQEDRVTPTGRRRQAPDWGGDDLFTSVPRRRFEAREHRGVGHVAEGIEHLDWTAQVGGTAARVDPRPDTVEHPVQRSTRPPVSPELRRRSPLELPDVTERTVALPERTAEPAVDGRRTVTITGHPDRLPPRRRPAPTLDERLYGRHPERIAMYAFALGLLLIVIAFLSANA